MRKRWIAVGVVAVVAVGGSFTVAGDADAKRKQRKGCRIESIAFPAPVKTFAETLPDDTYSVEWTTSAPTNADCGRRGILGLDVWEHAYYVVAPSDDGSDLLDVDGHIEYRVSGDFDGDGTTDVEVLRGRISGDGVDQDDVVTFAFNARGTSEDGSKLKLAHQGALDLRGEEWRDLDAKGIWFHVGANPSF